MNRVSLSKKMRFEIFKRDRFVCQYCGATPPNALLEVDHIVSVSEGGINDEGNLITACFDCNRGKGAVSLSVVPQSLSDRAAEIEEREAQLAGYRQIVQVQVDRVEADMWSVADILFPGGTEAGVRRDRLQSIKAFNRQLDLHEVVDAAEIARAKCLYSEGKRFRYFCGVCWNKIKRGGG